MDSDIKKHEVQNSAMVLIDVYLGILLGQSMVSFMTIHVRVLLA